MTGRLILLLALAGSGAMTVPPASAADVEAWIDTELQDGILHATPKVRVQSARTIRYELSAKKTGTSGTSSTAQAGTKAVDCCDPVTLATVRLSVAPADACTLTLAVYEKEEAVARIEMPCVKPEKP